VGGKAYAGNAASRFEPARPFAIAAKPIEAIIDAIIDAGRFFTLCMGVTADLVRARTHV